MIIIHDNVLCAFRMVLPAQGISNSETNGSEICMNPHSRNIGNQGIIIASNENISKNNIPSIETGNHCDSGGHASLTR